MEGGRVRGDPQSGSKPRAVPAPVNARPAAARPFGPVSPAATPEEFERELTRFTLSGEGWPLILRRLAAHTGHAAWLFDVHGELLAGSAAPTAPTGDAPTVRASDVAQVFGAERPVPLTMSDGRPARAASVRADRRRFGIVLLAEPVPPAVVPYLLASTTALAIEAVRRDAAAEAGTAAGAELVDELRCGTLRPADELTRAAARFGMRLDAPHAGVVFDYDGPHLRAWSTALPRAGVTALHEGRRAWVVVPGDDAGELERLRDRAQAVVGDGVVRAASGPVVTGADHTAQSFREAEVLIALLIRRGEQTVLPYASLGLAQLLVTVPPDRLREFVERHIGPLLPREDLVRTLRAWLASSGSRTAVADALHLHRNSVGYRVGQIKALLGVDPLDPEAIVLLQAALTAQELLLALDEHDPVVGDWRSDRANTRKTP
ncbi:PucR family transcriptional regulator [Cryptosporangium phraense]|uniref:PucR family transcriptional regulator n=1 Tax=Cryptosporangium phraense TaxID=2593070 RepID=A0A545AWL3_9ACTN|nr:helix-turn-helix domain-containing protein [Cryptosporangium phraense]TQS45716.1 PucR family transcriptional regulator [Cryptosporangium phraense]